MGPVGRHDERTRRGAGFRSLTAGAALSVSVQTAVAAPTRGLGGASVESQEGAPDSTLALYRNAIGLRAKHLRGSESFGWSTYWRICSSSTGADSGDGELRR